MFCVLLNACFNYCHETTVFHFIIKLIKMKELKFIKIKFKYKKDEIINEHYNRKLTIV